MILMEPCFDPEIKAKYIDKILAFLTTYPLSYIDFFFLIRVVDKKSTCLDYLPPPLVNVVKECPLSKAKFRIQYA